MTRFATLGGAALAALFVIASAGNAVAAPKKNTAITVMKADMVPVPAMNAPAPTPATTGSVSAGAPMTAEPTPPPSLGSDGATADKPPFRDEWDRRDRKRRRSSDHRLTSVLVPLGFFLCILLLVGTIQYIGFRKDRNRHQTLQLMVERGAQIPVELISPRKRRGSDLRKGLVLVGTGLGVMLFLLITKDARQSGAWGLGLIPAMIGAGYLLAWKLEKNRNGDGPDSGQHYINGGGYTPPPPLADGGQRQAPQPHTEPSDTNG